MCITNKLKTLIFVIYFGLLMGCDPEEVSQSNESNALLSCEGTAEETDVFSFNTAHVVANEGEAFEFQVMRAFPKCPQSITLIFSPLILGQSLLDYPYSLIVDFAPGETIKEFSVPTIEDDLGEGKQLVRARIRSNLLGSDLDTLDMIIIDNDDPLVLSLDTLELDIPADASYNSVDLLLSPAQGEPLDGTLHALFEMETQTVTIGGFTAPFPFWISPTFEWGAVAFTYAEWDSDIEKYRFNVNVAPNDFVVGTEATITILGSPLLEASGHLVSSSLHYFEIPESSTSVLTIIE